MKQALYVISALFLLAASVACNTTGCLNNQSSIPLAGCYSSSTGDAVGIASVVEFHGVGAPNDSVLSPATSAANRIYLPMRSTASRVRWCLHYLQEGINTIALNDTISFYYRSIPYFASEECGAMYEYVIQECYYTTHLIDSVAVLDSVITNQDIEKIKIFFRTAEEEPDDTGSPANSAQL